MINIDDLGVLIIGSRGREHALAWGLAQSPHVTRMWCAPGNPGMAEETLKNDGKVVCVPNLAVENIMGQRNFAKQNSVGLVVYGPEAPLVLGGADLLETTGLTVFGVNKVAARFEGSKCFAQEFGQRHGLPFAPGECFDDAAKAKAFAKKLGGRCVVKADGLCSGTGAFVCRTFEEACLEIDNLLVKNTLGAAGSRIVIQELLEGEELSLHILYDGKTWKLLPAAQDHKRLLNNDKGPNTGGMGAYSPFLTHAEATEIATGVIEPFLAGCAAEGIVFKGVLYVGLMLTKKSPKILEFNVRFGDPEAQVIVPRIKTDMAELLYTTATGRLSEVELEVHHDVATVCVVMVSGGYPETYQKSKPITGLDKVARMREVKVFHAGTVLNGNECVTNGGRVLGVTAWSPSLRGACALGYLATDDIYFEGVHFRTDIAGKRFS